MSVVSSITATSIGTTGATINYTLNSFASSIYLYRFQLNVVRNPLTIEGTLVQTVVPGTSSGSYTDNTLSSNTQYSYAFYNGNGSGSATPYNPFITIKTYVDVTNLTTSAITETATQINYTLSNRLSSLTTCYLYRFSSVTSIPSAPSTLNTSTGTFITSIDVNSGSNVTPTVVTSNYTDSTLTSNTSYVYAFYNGQIDTFSTILTDTNTNTKSASSTTFTSITTSSLTSSTISNSSATINYTLVNSISATTNSYLFRFAASSAPTVDPTSGVQVGSAITTTSSGTSSTPINSTGLASNTQYTFAFYNGTSSSATILRDTTRAVQSVSLYTTNVLNTSLTATSVTPVSATINYTLSNTPSSVGTTVYLYRFPGTNSAPSTLTGGTQMTSVALTANYSATSSSFSSTGLTVNTAYTYAFYSGSVAGTSILLTSDGTTGISVSINTTVTTVAFSATTNLLNTSATINYTLTNTSSTTVPSYLYRFAASSAPSLLNTSTGTYIASANSIGTAASTSDTGLTGATQYTYAFYNGQVNGTSSIITNTSGVAQSTSFNTTNLLNTSITAPAASILNTQATISYTLTNLGVNTTTTSGYLYRFAGSSAPTSNPTSGSLVTTISVSANASNTNTFINTGLSTATQYTYAFYNGSASSSTILTNSSSVNQSITLTTTNIVINTMTPTNITNTSAQVNYNISNSTTTQGTTVYLYRFTSPTTPPTTLTGGTNITSVTVNGSATVDASYNNTGLSSNIFYYAFYNGNTSGTNTIIPIATGGNYITVKDFVDISNLTATNITTTSAVINYTLNNGLSVNVTSYLYRFNSSTAPSSNPTSGGTNVTSVLTNSGTSSISSYSDPSLNINNIYTYAFYTGTSSSATILANTSGVSQSVTFITSVFVTALTASSIAITSGTINYSITNPLNSQVTAYLFRFIGNNAPSTKPDVSGTQITTATINANSSLNTQTFSNTGLTQNTLYTYAFYTGNTSSATILTNSTGTAQSVNVFTDMYIRTLTATTNIANTYVTLSYRLGNGNNSVSSNTSYIYRFAGATAPATLDTTLGTRILSTTTTSSTTGYDISVNPNTQYTYAFYDGSLNGVNTIMYGGTSSTSGPSYPLTATTSTVYTSNQVLTVFTSSGVFNTSSLLNYTITNNPASSTATVYLYRFTGSTPPTLLSGGTNITLPSNTISANGTLTNAALADTGLSASTIYYYAFYNGQVTGTSSLLPISGDGNYITVQTTGVTQSSISASSISSSGATINYTIANAASSSTATIYLYRYTGIVTATTPLNTTTGTQVTSVSPAIPITLTASGSTSTFVNITGLSGNTIYTFQFYNGNRNGSSPILSTTATGGTNQFVTFKTGVSDTALSNSNILNTSAKISYTLSNTNSSTVTSYLYRFAGSTAQPTLNTSTGTSITSIDVSGGSNASPIINTGSYLNTGIVRNSTYVYAFYNGQGNGSSTILTDVNGNSVSTSFTTANLLNSSLTTNSLTNVSVTIGYTLTNNSVTQTAYLYRFANSTAPSTLNTSTGTNIIAGGVSVGASGVTSTVTNSSLTSNTTYTYAFYDGSSNGSSSILTTNGSTAVQLTIFTTSNVIITKLSPTGLTSNQVKMNYTLYNYQGSSKTSYLYRFAGSSAPSILDSSGTNIIVGGVSTAALSGGNPGITDLSYINTGLSINTTYTYGFYNGQTNGTSVLLANYSGTGLTSTIYTTNESIVSSLTSSTLANIFNTINYIANNNQPTSRSLYLYRFLGTSAPQPTLSFTNNATLITNFTVASGGSSNNSIFDVSLALNTNYTYAFYNGNSEGTSIILTNYDGSPQTLNIATTDVFNPSLTASNISTSSATVNYTITNTPSSSGIIVYLYRFIGNSAPGTLTTTGSYSSATQLNYFPVSGGATVNSAYVDTLAGNTFYTYAFYNGNVAGTNTILQDASNTLNPVSVTLNSFYGIVSLLSATNTTNTSTNINYTIINGLTNSGTGYLYRFDSSFAVPSILDTTLTGATNLTSVILPANSSYFDSTLLYNSQYTYAFYNGTTQGVSTLLTNSSNIGQSVSVSTSNVYNSSLTNPTVSTNSVTIGYILNNNPSNVDASVYLYRFTNTSAPSVLSGGTSLQSNTVTKGTTTTSSYTDSTVTADNTYTYAFYNGNANGVSLILKNNSTELSNVSITVYTFYDIIAGLSVSSTSNTSAFINYSIQNTLTSTTTAYLYRFNNYITPPTILDTSLLGATNIVNIDILANSSINDQYFDPSLSINSRYTYAFYSGTSSGSSIILTDVNAVAVSATVSTSNVYNSTLLNTSTSTSSVTVSYVLNNNPSNTDAMVYLYRYVGSSAPSTLSNSGEFIMPSAVLVSHGTSLADSYIDNTVVVNNIYTYAFYSGNTTGSSVILQDTSASLLDKTLTVYVFYDLILDLSASGTTNTSTYINYSIQNTQSSSTTIYLYRFNGSISPPGILDTTLSGATNLTGGGGVIISANSTNTTYYFDPTLSANSQYTYAFYNGNSNDSSALLTDINNIGQSVSVSTSNIYNPVLSGSSISTDSVTLSYTLTNVPSNQDAVVYLYRYDGTSSPSLLNISGTLMQPYLVSQGTIISSTYTDNTVTADNIYTYAFYDGSSTNISPILQDTSANLNNKSFTVYTYYDIVASLTSGDTTNTYTTIYYSIQNTLTSNTSVYLYRFDASFAAPNPLNTGLTGATNLTRIDISANDTNTSSYFDPTLSINSQYTYSLYNGTTTGSSILLTDISNNGQSIVVSTSDVYNPYLIASWISIDSVELSYTLINDSSNTDGIVYLYRFSGSSSAPSVLVGGTPISSGITVLAGTDVSSSIIDSTVSVNNTYTYAFYSGNTTGSSVILHDNSISEMSVTVYIYYDLIVSLSSSGTTNISTDINYSIQNSLTVPTVTYLYRFDGNVSAPSPLNNSFANATNITSISILESSINTSSYTDSTLSPNSTYTYALYNGSGDGSSLLTNASNTPVQTTVTTGGEFLPPITYDVIVTTYINTSKNITLVGTDPQNSALSYTYGSPSNGIVNGAGPNLLYTPNADYVGTDSFTYYATNIYNLSSTPSTITIYINASNPPCFKEGSKILCFNEREGKEEYVPIEYIRKGTLVKTIYDGYLKVDMIGKSTIYNSGDMERKANRLFLCPKENYDDLTEDLIITGYHSILVDDFINEEQMEKTRELNGDLYVTSRKYRLPASADMRAIPYDREGEFTIWHLALENDKYYNNYGIYANGLLVESCSKRYLKEYSKMTLIE